MTLYIDGSRRATSSTRCTSPSESIFKMTTTVESQILDEVCAEAQNAKTAETLTWGQYVERIHWKNVFQLAFFHAGLVMSLIMYAFGLHSVPIKWWTIVWMIFMGYITGLGITAGAHRLWTHRAYKANLRLRILLMIMYSGVGMNHIFAWVRDHRVHHKYSETDADPHNAKRGFFFAHVGWLMQRRHPEYLRRAREINMTDILADPVVMFNKKYATELKWIFCFGIPSTVPVLFWGETLLHAVLTQCFIRYLVVQHFVWCVNSVAHLWGDRPYNRFINPAENLWVSFVSGGEGAHNYHHTFPWDYKAAEMPYLNFNLTTCFIHTMAALGWAYDLRKPSPELIEKVIQRIGHKSAVEAEY